MNSYRGSGSASVESAGGQAVGDGPAGEPAGVGGEPQERGSLAEAHPADQHAERPHDVPRSSSPRGGSPDDTRRIQRTSLPSIPPVPLARAHTTPTNTKQHAPLSAQ